MDLLTWQAMVVFGLILFTIGMIWKQYKVVWMFSSSLIMIPLGMITKVNTYTYQTITTNGTASAELQTITYNLVPFNYVLLLFGIIILIFAVMEVFKIYSQKYYDNYK
jgi:hypothetical protein